MTVSLLIKILVFYPFIGAILTRIVGKKHDKGKCYLADFVVITEFIMMLLAALLAMDSLPASVSVGQVCGFGLNFALDGFRIVYGLVASFMWMMTTTISREYMLHHDNQNRYYFFLLATLGATMGVFLSTNLFTTFIFFEVMSFTSYVWVAQEETEGALRAADTYLAVAVIGGLTMLMGIFMIYSELGSLQMDELLTLAQASDNKGLLYVAGALMVVGFGAKAGAFPLHIWLPKAHPVAPAPASALLSGILTKSGIFGVIVVSTQIFLSDSSWGMVIMWLGVITMFGGAMLAVFSIDLKRTLACSSMSQIGFIMIGIGSYDILHEEQFLAANGSILHMINHSMIKLVLFMAAGVIYMNTHTLDLNRLKGFGRKKPLLMGIFLVGALAIGGIPMFSGYVSKTLLHEGILAIGPFAYVKAAEIIFLFSGGLTVAYMTKLFVCIFIEKNEDPALQAKYDEKKHFMSLDSAIALTGSAIVLLIWGFFPQKIMIRVAEFTGEFFNLHLLEGEEEEEIIIHFFNLENLKGAAISITVGALVYFFIIRKLLMKDGRYINRWPAWWDVENLIYRPILMVILPAVFGFFSRVFDSAVDELVVLLRKTVYRDSPLPREPKALSIEGLRRETNVDIVRRSLSYGFVLFGIGFLAFAIYVFM